MFRNLAIRGCLLALLLLPASLQAQAEKVVQIEGITEYRLPNGVRFLLFPDPAASTVTINMTVLVGSRHEGYGETGMAHLLEHMLFKGSKNYPDADKELTGRGAESNGTTWVDRTNYYETMPATDANLEFGIKFEADRLVNCFIKREDLVKEMTVVRNEFENGENNPENVLSQRMMAVAFEWHNYGKSTIGNRSDIERVPIDRLHAFYKKYYQPDNVVLIIAGKFDQAKAIKTIEASFGAIPKPNRTLEATYTEEPAQDGERNVILRRVGKVAVVGVMYHIPAAAHVDNSTVEVLSRVLGTPPSGRLYKALVETKKATKVSVDSTSWHDPGVLEITASVATGVMPEEVRDIILKELDDIATRPIDKEEVARAVKKFLSEREQAQASSKRIALELSEWIGAGDWRLLFLFRDRVAKVTPEAVNGVAKKFLETSNRTVGLFIPSDKVNRTPIPETPDIVALVKDYKGGEGAAQGEVFDPTPENIEKRVKRLTLGSGIKVALLPKKTRGEAVTGVINLHFGNDKSLQGNTSAAQFVGPLLRRGTEKHTRQELNDLLDKYSSSVVTSSATGSVTVNLQSKRPSLPAVLDLVREMLREPTFPNKEFEELRANLKQQSEKSMVDPQPLAFNSLVRQLQPYPADDVRYRPTFQESLERLKKLSREDVVKLYQDQVGGGDGEIVLIGDFDADQVASQLEKMFAGWKAKVPYARIKRSIPEKLAANRDSILTPDKEGAVYAAGWAFPFQDSHPDYASLELGNFLLGGNFSSRLIEKLRQKDGLCYGAGSRVQIDSQDPYTLFFMFGICNPENIDKVDQGALNELAKLCKEGTNDAELTTVKKSYLEEMIVDRGKDAMIAAMLREGLELGRTFHYYTELEKKIQALTVEDVNRALRTHLSPERLITVRAGDFNKKK